MKLLVKTRNVTGIKRKRALCGQKIQRRDGTYVELEGWVKLGQAERWGKADGIHEHRYGHKHKTYRRQEILFDESQSHGGNKGKCTSDIM